MLSLGAEYFFNQAGVSDPVVYPWLIYQSQFLPFYVGKHYGGLIATSQGLPFGLTNMGLTLVNLGNFSDMSFVSRLLWNMRILSYLQVEAYTAYHYGTKGGEFRFGLDLPPLPLGPGQFTPPIFIPAPQWELGAGVRVNL